MTKESMDRNRHEPGPTVLSGERARQGRIVLNTPRRRAIFLGGLVAFVLLAVLGSMLLR